MPAGVRARRLQRETWLRGRCFPRAARWDSPSPHRHRLRSPRATTDTRTHRQMAGGWPAAGTCVFRRVSDGEGLPQGWGGAGERSVPPCARVCCVHASALAERCAPVCWCARVCARVCVLWVGICRCGHMRCACGCAKCAYVCLCAPYVCIVGQARVRTCARLCAHTRCMCAFRHVRVRAHTCARLLCAQIWVVSLPGFVPVPPQGPALGCCHVPMSPPSPCPMQVLQAGRGKAATLGSCPHAAGAPVGAAAVPPPMAELVTLRRAHLRGPILR